MQRPTAAADANRVMRVLRLTAAGIVAVLAFALGTASVVAFFAGGYFSIACLYGLVTLGLAAFARRLRPRRRFVFARR
jgi:hypothetical protein